MAVLQLLAFATPGGSELLDPEASCLMQQKVEVISRTRMSPANSEGRNGNLFAFINFPKTGSSTVRAILDERRKKHGWQCPKDPEALPGHPKCVCREETLDFSSKEPPECSSLEDGMVLQSKYGYCDLLKGIRPCLYLTILREPVSRMVSDYNYFCLECSEGGRYCQPWLKSSTCPHKTFLQYARQVGNIYTAMFSGKHDKFPALSPNFSRILTESTTSLLTREDLHVAQVALQRKDMLVLRIETLFKSTRHEPAGMEYLSNFLNDKELTEVKEIEANTNEHRYEPSDSEISELRKILELDLLLYNSTLPTLKL